MDEVYRTVNGLGFVGWGLAATALFYAIFPAETVNVLRGIGELFGIKKEES